MTDNSRISVMLVDDSAVIRGALTKLLEEDSSIDIVSSVSNGEIALNALDRHRPDIIILDIEMPVMDGITALPQILKKSPTTKVIMFSTLTEKGADITLKALSLGAVECMVKPAAGDAKPGGPFQKQLLSLLHNLTGKGKEPRMSASSAIDTKAATDEKPSLLSPNAPIKLYNGIGQHTGKPDLIAIGSSTGGPQALFTVIKSFGQLDVPIVLTQHMPATFTKILANHINNHTGLPAVEGEDGMKLVPGRVHVAPGGKHMLLRRSGLNVTIELNDGPMENFCKPAVDPMFRSAVDVYGKKILGVILTGMGNDGLKGGQIMVEKGGRLIAQDQATSVVWGMPGAVAKAGICSAVLPLNDIGPWVKKAVTGSLTGAKIHS